MDEREVICEKRGAAGFITLNRPKALNALTLTMVRGMAQALDDWEKDDSITRIVITGAGEKGFCAGGDIRQLYEQGKAGQHEEALTFWREEYLLNIRIRNYPKPYVALIDGIVMGGGVGVSAHGSHKVAGDRYLFAMPEVGIGFFPDVGGSYVLPRLAGKAGTWLAVSGDRIKAGDAVALRLADAYVPSANMPALIEDLVAGKDVDEAIAAHRAEIAPALSAADRATIDHCFDALTVADIVAKLDKAAADGSTFAAKVAASMRTKSPTSLALSLRQMQLGAGMTMEEAMTLEYRIVSRICHGHDFYEGVRAVIVDKDNAPKWQPARIEDIDPEAIEAHFKPLDKELPVAGTRG